MNPYNSVFTGAENEMSQFIQTMKNPCIKVTLKHGGAASAWNWDTELSFPSGVEVMLPERYLDTGHFALFGNDDVITEVEIYDMGQSGSQTTVPPTPMPTKKPEETIKPVETEKPEETTQPSQTAIPTATMNQGDSDSHVAPTKNQTLKMWNQQ